MASLIDPALDRILDFASESGLLVLLHNDMDVPFAPSNTWPLYLKQMSELLSRHQDAVVIWAHMGLGRVVHPARPPASAAVAKRPPNHLDIIRAALKDPVFTNLHFDISWSEVAKYIVGTPKALNATADMINAYPDRFLFGTDEVAPQDQEAYLRVYRQYAPLWKALSPEARLAVTRGNYERLFDAANKKVRAWESEND